MRVGYPLFLSVAGVMSRGASLTVMDSENGGDELTPADISAMTFNPFYAIELDPTLTARHEPIISEDQWIAENIELITELGPKPHLRNLLVILKRRIP